MKQLLLALLAALPMQAVANDEDPIAYKCYYCTPDEMEVAALAQGVGQHYVYDANKLSIVGFDVSLHGGTLKAEAFTAPSWVTKQFLGMMRLYNPKDGHMNAAIKNVHLLAPGTEHGKSSRYLWGHHLSALNPYHDSARELVHRYLMESPATNFLDTTLSNGKLLRFEYMLDGTRPITAEVMFLDQYLYFSDFYFDHESRKWIYLGTRSNLSRGIQEIWNDFAPTPGEWRYSFLNSSDRYHGYPEALIQRAEWAGIPVHGSLPPSTVIITCTRASDDIQCYIK